MTTTVTASKYRYVGNGVTDTFAFSGRVFQTSDIVVDIITRATGALVETLTETTDYTVTIADNGTASVTVVAGKIPSALQDILLRRSVSQSQSTALPSGTRFPAKSVEDGLDRLTILTQDLQEQIDRSVKLPAQTSVGDVSLPNPVDGTFITWDGTDGDLLNSTKTLTEVEDAVDAVAALVAGSGVLVSADDTTTGFLNGKLLGGTEVTLTEGSGGGNETLTISLTDNTVATAKLSQKTGADTNVVTGTAGTTSKLLMWNADGDAVDSGVAETDFATAAQGALADTAVQPAALADYSKLGVGQTSQDVTASRAADTVYTNTTGRPIKVTVSMLDGTSNPVLLVDEVIMAQGANTRAPHTVIVPNGSTYEATRVAGGSPTIDRWSELR